MNSTMSKLYGDVGATTDLYYIINGNVPGQLKLVKEENSGIGIHNYEGQRVSVRGRFGEKGEFDKLQPFHVYSIVSHQKIAERASELSKQNGSVSSVENWLQAEEELLGS